MFFLRASLSAIYMQVALERNLSVRFPLSLVYSYHIDQYRCTGSNFENNLQFIPFWSKGSRKYFLVAITILIKLGSVITPTVIYLKQQGLSRILLKLLVRILHDETVILLSHLGITMVQKKYRSKENDSEVLVGISVLVSHETKTMCFTCIRALYLSV